MVDLSKINSRLSKLYAHTRIAESFLCLRISLTKVDIRENPAKNCTVQPEVPSCRNGETNVQEIGPCFESK